MRGFKETAMPRPWSGYLEWKDPDEFPENEWDTDRLQLKKGTPKNIVEQYNAYVRKQKRMMERASKMHIAVTKE